MTPADEALDERADQRLDGREEMRGKSMRPPRGLMLTRGTLTGLSFIQKYRFLTIPQFARTANFSIFHARDVLRTLEGRGALGFFGYVSIPGQGRTPKVYYLKRKGWEYLRDESGLPEEEIGPFQEVSPELTWTPQMYHRLRLLDCFIALETQILAYTHLELVRTFLEYRRVRSPDRQARETSDYVSEAQMPETRIVPDGAFIIDNIVSNRRALFFLEMDMGTERIEVRQSRDRRATIKGKFEQYDRYLTSGRFARTYAPFGEFRSFLLLFVTYGHERIANIRQASTSLSERLHPYYRLATFEDATTEFFGPIWLSRSPSDTVKYALTQRSAEK